MPDPKMVKLMITYIIPLTQDFEKREESLLSYAHINNSYFFMCITLLILYILYTMLCTTC